MLALADAIAMLQHGRIAGRPEALVHRALNQAPDHPIALWLAGMAAREHQNYRQALDYWHKLIPLLKPGSADKLELKKLIRQVEGQL